jgi:hypothetical protein
VLVNPGYWELHRTSGHIIEWLPIVMLLTGLIARLPRRMHGLSILLFLLFVLQYVFLWAMPGIGLPGLRALHAVNALVFFAIAWRLGGIAWRMLRSPQGAPS